MSMPDLVIRNARLRRATGLFDITINRGRIAGIKRASERRGATIIDAAGGLVTESHLIPHVHLDKVETMSIVGDRALRYYNEEGMVNAEMAVRTAAAVKKHYNTAEIYERAKKLCTEALANGVTHIRAFADVDKLAKLKATAALCKLRDELRGRLDLQVVAFPQEGFGDSAANEELLWKAVESGCDVVGGIPWIERDDRARRRHVDHVFEIAVTHNRDAAFLSDDAGNPALRTTEMIAAKCLKTGWNGRAEICHARAMSIYPANYLNRLIPLLRSAQVSLVVNPHTGPLCAPVKRLRAGGVNVTLGQDDCNDAYYPYGRCNMLEVGFLASHILRMMTFPDMETLYDMITVNAARAIGVQKHALRLGAKANLVVYPQRSVQELLRFQPRPQVVIRGGMIVAKNP